MSIEVYFMCLKCAESEALTDYGKNVIVKWVTTCPDCNPEGFSLKEHLCE